MLEFPGPPEGPTASSDSKKRPIPTPKPTTSTTKLFRSPSWTYIHLSLTSLIPLPSSSSSTPPVDVITLRTNLTSALTQFIGLHGSAISVDILKVEGQDAWIRVPREDGHALMAALSGWVGNGVAWRVKGSGSWLGGVVNGGGRDLFLA